MPNLIYTVYQTTNLLNQKIYIGVHATSNPNDEYLGSGKHLLRSIKKNGNHCFSKKVLFQYNNPEDMFQKEKDLVTETFIKQTTNYNIIVGGQGGRQLLGKYNPFYNKTHTTKTKNKISNARKGKHSGKNNYQFSGYFVTPNGTFETSKQVNDIFNITSARNWCKTYNKKPFTLYSVLRSKYLKELSKTLDVVGKTPNDLGFNFIPV